MILKDDHKKSWLAQNIFKLLLLAIIVVVGIYLVQNVLQKSNSGDASISTSMEHKNELTFVEGDVIFNNAHTQSSEKSRTGKYSCLINKQQKFGASYDISNVEKGDKVCASIWRWTRISENGYLAAQGNDGSDFSFQTNRADETDEEGWDLLSFCFSVPENDALSSIKIFPYSMNEVGEAYFDDLSINVTKADSLKKVISSLDVRQIDLYIDQKGYKEIQDVREEALRYGILINNGQWTKAKLKENGITQNVKLRLKGDWTDHLEGKKWSYRIKTSKESSWNRMQTFSIQSPERRFFVKEWLFHDLLKREDILTTRYDFIWLKLNDQGPMVYAYEEHFVKHLPESNNRREGVIVKYTEDAAWAQRLRSKKATGNHSTELVAAKYHSDIEPFSASKVEGDSSLMKQFTEAQELMYAYKHYLKPVEEIFDIDRMAKYYAILEVLNAYHSLVWHNQRFYYNPVTRLLEPIGYDGFIQENEYIISANVCFGYYKSNKHMNDEWGKFYNVLFRNKAFAEKYASYLNKFSTLEYIKGYLDLTSDALDQRENLLKTDYPDYTLDRKAIVAKAKAIHASIPAYDNVSLKAYTNKTDKSQKHLSISNYHHLPLQVLGSGTEASNNPSNIKALEKTIWSNHPLMAPEYVDYTIPKDHTIIYYNVLGLEEIHFSRVKKWPSGNNMARADKLKNTLILPLDENDYAISDSTIRIHSGKYTLSTPMIIPRGKTLFIEAGTEIDLTNKAYIYSSSKLYLDGTADLPIKIFSSDHTGQGLLVLKAPEKSILKYAQFDHLDNLDEGSYFMTGAVTFYESMVELYHCNFANNHCEDALNMIRSDFIIDKMHLSNTYSDGFDADFCSGTVSNSYSVDTGNDAFDFSGSRITIENCTFKNIGDKGISAGEQATIKIISSVIDGADIGVASKDLSEVTIDNITVKNCNKAFAAYQKKPEYGPATITIKNYTAINNKFLELKEDDSKIDFLNNPEE